MGLIYSQDFITVADAAISARSSTAGYDKIDIMDYWHLKARHRAADLTKSDVSPLFKIDMGAAKTVSSVLLLDVNYDVTRIFGHASSLASDWSTASYDSADVSVSQNPWTGRYNAYIPLTSFNYRWLAVGTPAAASTVGSYQTYWETGLVCILDSVTELSMDYAMMRQSTEQLFENVGRSGRVSLNDVPGWVGEVSFGERRRSLETELRTLGRADLATPIMFYLNDSDTSEAYVCLLDQGYSSEWFGYDAVRGGQSMKFREIVGV